MWPFDPEELHRRMSKDASENEGDDYPKLPPINYAAAGLSGTKAAPPPPLRSGEARWHEVVV